MLQLVEIKVELTVPEPGKITETTATLTCTTSLSSFICGEPLGCALASAKHCSYGYSTRLTQRQSEAALKACLFEIEGNLFNLWKRSTREGKEQGDAARGSAVRARLGHYRSLRLSFIVTSPGGLAPH